MKTQQKYLDDLADLTETGSDYAIAKMLGVTRQRISNYRAGRHHFDQEMCFRVAEALGLNPIEVIAALAAEKEKDKEKARAWRERYRRYAGRAAAVFLAAALSVSPRTGSAAEFNISDITRTQNMYYAHL